MEILIVVVVVACILLALIPRFIAIRSRREPPAIPTPSRPSRPSPLSPTGPEATATIEAPPRVGDRIGKTRERLAGAFRSLRNRSSATASMSQM